MGLITGYSQNKFISAEEIYSKIRREFKSFTSSNLIDEGEFPVYTKEVLDKLGMSAMQECETVLDAQDGKCKLPYNFQQLHSAYRCTCSCSSDTETWHPQSKSAVRVDTTCETVQTNNCTIDCSYNEDIIHRVTIQEFIKDDCISKDYNNFILLRLSPNVKSVCADGCINFKCNSPYEIGINSGYIYSNFNDSIYIKYYGLAVDDDGLPMIPDITEVKKAVEWYIKYQLLLNWWFNSEVQDIQNKWGKAEQLYEQFMAEARYINKLPSFSEMINAARNQRANNKVTFFSNQYRSA